MSREKQCLQLCNLEIYLNTETGRRRSKTASQKLQNEISKMKQVKKLQKNCAEYTMKTCEI